MNIKDIKYLAKEIKKAKHYKSLFINSDRINEFNFWNGYLNALELIEINQYRNYKL